MKQRILMVLGVAAVALVAASAATAGNVTATANVAAGNSGNLALSLPSNPSISSTLDGTDQTASYSLGLGLNDVRGSGAGWNLTITSTAFSDGTHSLATDSSIISGLSTGCLAGGTCTNPTNSLSYPLAVPAAAGSAPTAVKFFNAAANTGMGRFTVTPSIDVAVPGNAYAGGYTSTVTIAAVSGP
jgi:WxL domain surface cell wall-binding